MEIHEKIKIDHTITIHRSMDSLRIFVEDDSKEGGFVNFGLDITAQGSFYFIPLEGGKRTVCGFKEARYLSGIIEKFLN